MTTLQVNSAIEREAVLLQQINTPLPAQTLADYQELSQKLRDERITPDEHAHLRTLVDVVELADAERMQHLSVFRVKPRPSGRGRHRRPSSVCRLKQVFTADSCAQSKDFNLSLLPCNDSKPLNTN